MSDDTRWTWHLRGPNEQIIDPERHSQYSLALSGARYAYMIEQFLEYVDDKMKTDDIFEQLDIEAFYKNPKNEENFQNLIKHMEGPHFGDCTAVPATCIRCYVEHYIFGLWPTTAWRTKAEGHNILKGYTEEMKELQGYMEKHKCSEHEAREALFAEANLKLLES